MDSQHTSSQTNLQSRFVIIFICCYKSCCVGNQQWPGCHMYQTRHLLASLHTLHCYSFSLVVLIYRLISSLRFILRFICIITSTWIQIDRSHLSIAVSISMATKNGTKARFLDQTSDKQSDIRIMCGRYIFGERKKHIYFKYVNCHCCFVVVVFSTEDLMVRLTKS